MLNIQEKKEEDDNVDMDEESKSTEALEESDIDEETDEMPDEDDEP